MAATSRATGGRKAAARSTSSNANAHASDEPALLDQVLDDLSQNAAKEQIAWEISTANAVLRNTQALSEAQLDTTMRVQQVHEKAAQQLEQAQGLNELAAVQMRLAQADLQTAFELWARFSQTAAVGAMQAVSEAVSSCARMQNAMLSSLTQWSRLSAALPSRPGVPEAEVEHATNPVAASPMMAWPAQQATRQAMTMATTTWNDWLSMTGRMMGNGAMSRSA